MSRVFRNIAAAAQLFFWYFARAAALPAPRQSYALPFGSFLNMRGFYLPAPIPEPGFDVGAVLALVVGIVAVVRRLPGRGAARWRRASSFRCCWTSLALIVGCPLAVFISAGAAAGLRLSRAQGLQFRRRHRSSAGVPGAALGLSIYTAAFIAEIVRAGIQGVSQGPERGRAAPRPRTARSLRLVVIPQAMRIIIPPLTSQYLNLTKNSSLAVAIGYPDLVSVCRGTVLNQTGQAVEVILITMVRLSRHQPADLGLHELVQRAHGAGGAVRAEPWLPTRDVAAKIEQPPPPQSVGAIALAAHNLFSSCGNTLLTVMRPTSSCLTSVVSWRSSIGRSISPTVHRRRRQRLQPSRAPAPAGPSSTPSSASSCTAATRRAERWRVDLVPFAALALLRAARCR